MSTVTILKSQAMDNTETPKAEPRETTRTFFDGQITLTDDFAWLRDPDWEQADDGVKDPQIMAYIKSEEAYADAFLAPLKPVIDDYVQLRLNMIPKVDDSYPYLEDGYYYFTRTSNEADYPVHYRYRSNQSKEDAVAYFDTIKEAEGHEFYSVSGLDVSPNGQLLAYSIDTKGNEKYTMRIRDLDTTSDYTDLLVDVDGSVVWTPDNQGFYYVKRDSKDRSKFVYYHKIGQTQAADVLVYTEMDDTAHMGIGFSADKKYLFVETSTKDEDGIQGLVLGATPDHKLQTLVERKAKRKVGLAHRNGYFYIHTNDTGDNFRIAKTPVGEILNDAAWQEILPADKDRYITSFQVLANGIAVGSRNLGLSEIGVLEESTKSLRLIPMADKAYDAKLRGMSYEAEFLRFSYSSLSKPPSVIEAKFDTLETTVCKVREIPSGHNPDDFVTDRVFFAARDGVQVPVSLVYKKDKFTQDGTKPLFLYGYGSYGANIPPEFLEWILPLLDQGFAYAIAHIRGGDDMGYSWYLDGKMEKKENTFNDFIDVAKGLIEQKYTSQGNITAMGGSAGGLLMGAVANKAPELFKSIVSMVPFVDLVNTMLDGTLPLTPGEYKEWGNPATDPEVFKRLLSYSPYDNLAAGIDYPAMYIAGGLFDFRVTYWEPLKYVAKLRHVSPETPVWLRMKTAGHGGGTALKDRLRERGEVYAFTLKMHDLIK